MTLKDVPDKYRKNFAKDDLNEVSQSKTRPTSLWFLKRKIFRIPENPKKDSHKSVWWQIHQILGNIFLQEFPSPEKIWTLNFRHHATQRLARKKLKPSSRGDFNSNNSSCKQRLTIHSTKCPLTSNHANDTNKKGIESEMNQNSTDFVISVANDDTVNGISLEKMKSSSEKDTTEGTAGPMRTTKVQRPTSLSKPCLKRHTSTDCHHERKGHSA